MDFHSKLFKDFQDLRRPHSVVVRRGSSFTNYKVVAAGGLPVNKPVAEIKDAYSPSRGGGGPREPGSLLEDGPKPNRQHPDQQPFSASFAGAYSDSASYSGSSSALAISVLFSYRPPPNMQWQVPALQRRPQ